MKLLLDTHVLFWWCIKPTELSTQARLAIEDTAEIFVSAASAWEIATKVRIGKWDEARDIAERFTAHLAAEEFDELPVRVVHGRHAGLMPGKHKDPFDRLILAQALIEGMTIVTADPKLSDFGAPVIW